MSYCVIKARLIPILILFHLAFFALAKSALAQETVISGLIIRAQSFDFQSGTDEVHLTGDVQVIFNSQHLSATKVVIDRKKKTISAYDDVVIVTPQATIAGDRVVMDYESNTGTIYQGYVESGQVLFQGEVINKSGPNTYNVIQGDYTACGTCPPAWSFSGKSIEAELGGYARIEQPFFRVGGVPVIWLPYLLVPLKSDRQSGFLIPSIENTENGGTAFAQSYFWAMSRSQDSTWTLKNHALRGNQAMVNYRYLLSEKSGGELEAFWLYDRAFGREDRLNRFRNEESHNEPVHRLRAKYDHYYELPYDLIQRTEIHYISDLQLLKDFPRDPGVYGIHGDTALTNRLSLTKNTESIHSRIESAYFINLLQSNPMATNEDAVHRLPQINFSGIEKQVGESGFFVNYNIDYTNFARESFGYDNLSRTSDGLYYVKNSCNDPQYQNADTECGIIREGYNPGTRKENYRDSDLIRAGQRLDIQPTLSYPFQLGPAIDILPSISYRETHYRFAVDEDAQNTRRYLRTSISARSMFSKVYGDLANPQSNRFKHEIEPELIMTTVPWIHHPDHPFFFVGDQNEIPFFRRESLSNEDLRGDARIQFDANDRLYDRELITLALTNKLIQKRWDKEQAVYRQLVRLRLAQTYDAYQARILNDPSRGWQDLQMDLDMRLNQFQTNTQVRYYPQFEVSDVRARARINGKRNDFFQVEWTRRHAFRDGSDDSAILTLNDYRITAGVNGKYIDLVGQLVYDSLWNIRDRDKPIKAWVYAARFKAPGNCWNINFIQSQPTDGDRTFSVNFEFKFDGETFSGLSPDILDTYTY